MKVVSFDFPFKENTAKKTLLFLIVLESILNASHKLIEITIKKMILQFWNLVEPITDDSYRPLSLVRKCPPKLIFGLVCVCSSDACYFKNFIKREPLKERLHFDVVLHILQWAPSLSAICPELHILILFVLFFLFCFSFFSL